MQLFRQQFQSRFLRQIQQKAAAFQSAAVANRLNHTPFAPPQARERASTNGVQISEQSHGIKPFSLSHVLGTNVGTPSTRSHVWKYDFAFPGVAYPEEQTERSNALLQQEIGLSILSHMRRGELVPDDVVEKALQTRLCQQDCGERGWVLDGYPRTAEQARKLMSSSYSTRPEVIVEIDMDATTALQRISKRGRAAGITSSYCSSAMNGSCARPDDVDLTVGARRQADYETRRASVIGALRDCGLPVATIDANGDRSVQDVADEVDRAIGNARRIVLLGRAGCGKSVQGRILQSKHNDTGPVHVSTGDLLRQLAQSAQLPILSSQTILRLPASVA